MVILINKSVEYGLLFSIDGISLERLIIRVRGGLAIEQSGLTDSSSLRQLPIQQSGLTDSQS